MIAYKVQVYYLYIAEFLCYWPETDLLIKALPDSDAYLLYS